MKVDPVALDRRRTLRLLFGSMLLAVAARAALVALVVESEGCTLAEYSRSADGYQALAMAAGWRGDLDAVRGQGFFEGLLASGGFASSHLVRFFPAGPGVLALAQAGGLPAGVAATLPFWLLAGLAAGIAAIWANDGRVGMLVALAPPIALYASSFPDSWGWLLSCALCGLLAAKRNQPLLAGVALGLAGWARPEGLIPLFAVVATFAAAHRWRDLSRLATGAALAVAAGAALVVMRFAPLLVEIVVGRPVAVAGSPAFLDLPGRALVEGFSSSATPAWKLVYVAAHLAVAGVALALLVARARGASSVNARADATILAIWLALQLALILVLRGGQGFDDLPRHTALASPAILAALLPWLPRSRWWVAVLGAMSFVVATVPARKNARPECGALPTRFKVESRTGFKPRPLDSWTYSNGVELDSSRPGSLGTTLLRERIRRIVQGRIGSREH